MNYPTYIEYRGKYTINSDFHIALECIKIINDEKITDTERSIAVVTMLFGEKIPVNEDTVELAVKFLQCGKKKKSLNSPKKDMDFEQDIELIEASFMSDYKLDISEIELHWWKFCNLISGLTSTSALNRIREIRNYDLSTVKDEKSRLKIIEAQQQVALKTKVSKEEQIMIDDFEELFL